MISKSTEYIFQNELVQKLIRTFNLNVGFLEWEGIKVPVLFNKFILLDIYVELGSLELSVTDLINWKWNRIPIDSYNPINITHREYFDKITSKIIEDKNFNTLCNQYLHYYINFIIDYLPEIFNGDFRKIENHMELVSEDQKEEILRVIG